MMVERPIYLFLLALKSLFAGPVRLCTSWGSEPAATARISTNYDSCIIKPPRIIIYQISRIRTLVSSLGGIYPDLLLWNHPLAGIPYPSSMSDMCIQS